jgi:hypothetical protein
MTEKSKEEKIRDLKVEIFDLIHEQTMLEKKLNQLEQIKRAKLQELSKLEREKNKEKEK